MSMIEQLKEVKTNLEVILENTSDNDKEVDKITELEEKIEAIKKKETRGFISDNEAEEELTEVQKKLSEIKEKLNKE